MSKTKLFAAGLLAVMWAAPALAAPRIPVAGNVGDVPFPDRSRSYLSEGDFVNIENLRQMRPGLDKDQIRILLGNPHFKEGIVGVREWNYIFNFRTGSGDEYITCQYQVRFEKENGRYIARSLHWDGPACMDLLNAQPQEAAAPAAEPVAGRRYELSADVLFAFAKWQLGDITPPGRDQLDALAGELAQAKVSSLKVTGHTDPIGSDADNQLLSERRARTVLDYLLARGVKADRTGVEGRGEREQVKACGNLPRAELIRCLAPNRRVEILVNAAE